MYRSSLWAVWFFSDVFVFSSLGGPDLFLFTPDVRPLYTRFVTWDSSTFLRLELEMLLIGVPLLFVDEPTSDIHGSEPMEEAVDGDSDHESICSIESKTVLMQSTNGFASLSFESSFESLCCSNCNKHLKINSY